MKHSILILFATVLLSLGGGDTLRELVLTPNPKMHCESCENRIKQNMRFEKGVKKIVTDLERQQVTITYDPKKNTVEGLREGMKRIGYETTVVSDSQLKPAGKPSKKK